MKYTITKIERKTTSTGKMKADVSLMDENGQETVGVTMWGDYPNFATLTEGSVTSGDVQVKVNGQYTNKTLYPERTNTLGRGNGVKAAQERKEVMIEKAQDRKNNSIAYFNAVNSAIALYSAIPVNDKVERSTQEFITKWRDWFLSEWQKYDAQDDSSKQIPF